MELAVNIPEQGISHHTLIALATAETIQEIGVVEVSLKLAYIAVELIYTAFVGCGVWAFVPTREEIYTMTKTEALEVLKNEGITESEQMLLRW